MIAPTFEPGSAPGAGVAAYATGMNQGQSWMERSNQMALQQQEEQLRQQQIQQNTILQPVMQAKAQADLATAANTLVSAKTLQDLRTRAAMAGPQAEQELLAASQIPDFTQQEAALGALQAKYSWMENVPEMKPLVSTIDNARAKATTMVLANKHIEAAQMVADTRAQGALDVAAERAANAKEIADLRAENEKYKADVAASSRSDVANITAGSRTESAHITASARDSATSSARIFSQEADTLERAAQTEVDSEAKSLLQRKAQAYRNKADKLLSVAPAETPEGKSTSAPVVAPTHVDKNASTVTIGGANYPVFKDAQGNRAYKIDGHFVPLTAD